MDEGFGSIEGVDAYCRAQNIIKKFNEECLNENPAEKAKVYAKIQQTETGETIVAVCDPFMQRVHETIPQSGEIVMMDATSNLDRGDTKVFHLVCPNCVGALPFW